MIQVKFEGEKLNCSMVLKLSQVYFLHDFYVKNTFVQPSERGKVTTGKRVTADGDGFTLPKG